MNNIVPNRIKQPGQCCENCGKSFKKRTNLADHYIVCDLIQKSKKSTGRIKILEDEEETDIPSPQKMYYMLLEMTKKYNKLQEQMDEMSKLVVRKKKKINFIEWLNENVAPNMVFEQLINLIVICEEDFEFIMNNSFYDTIHQIFSRSLEKEISLPIFAFNQKVNVFYIFIGMGGWIELPKDKLIRFLNKVHIKLADTFYSWRKIQILHLGVNKDKFETACDKTIVKLMSIEFSIESMFSKARSVLFNCLKKDIKSLIEYEIEV
jgi:uncharacterized protein YeeX (DUF496 family)